MKRKAFRTFWLLWILEIVQRERDCTSRSNILLTESIFEYYIASICAFLKCNALGEVGCSSNLNLGEVIE